MASAQDQHKQQIEKEVEERMELLEMFDPCLKRS
jgi:hypothetical protein